MPYRKNEYVPPPKKKKKWCMKEENKNGLIGMIFFITGIVGLDGIIWWGSGFAWAIATFRLEFGLLAIVVAVFGIVWALSNGMKNG